jgi:hypothetical protein
MCGRAESAVVQVSRIVTSISGDNVVSVALDMATALSDLCR